MRSVPGPLASWGSRAAAMMIDGVILVLPFVLVGGVFVAMIVGARTPSDPSDPSYPRVSYPGLPSDGAGAIMLVIGCITFLAVTTLYAPLLMARGGARNGQTWGRQMVGIRAVRDNGQPWDFGSALLREVVVKGIAVSVVASIVPVLPWILNYCWPLWDREHRALHDIAVSSHVVRA